MTSVDRTRRQLLRAGLLPLVGTAWPAARARAQAAWPKHAVRLVIGTPPGSGTDTWARLLAVKLGTVFGQPLIVDNRPGGNGQVACNIVKNADKDGYTLLYASGGLMAINPSVYGKSLSYDTLRDFDPVVGLERGTMYLAVNKDLPVHNVPEMVAWVKAHPGKANFGSDGSGSTSHLAMEMLKRATDMQMTHVPYRGSAAALQDLMGGQVQFSMAAATVMLPQRTAGTVRLIGTSGLQRSSVAPDIATIAEQGYPGFDAEVWSGLFVPAGSPAGVQQQLNAAVNRLLAAGDFAPTMKAVGAEPLGGSAQDFRTYIAQEIARWAPVVKSAGVVAD